MSYLDRPRLHFFGQFTANPSTVNNEPSNYDPKKPITKNDVAWNPDGRHNFSLNKCKVTGVVMDGKPGNIKGTVATSQTGVLVDLDPQQQGVSQIIGMKLTISVGGGSVTGTFKPVNFVDIFNRPRDPVVGDGNFSASYQSVLTNLQWDEEDSPFLTALKGVSAAMLSIKFNVDGYHDNSKEKNFTLGRVAGTIGPQLFGEPTSFVFGRLLRPTNQSCQYGNFNFAPAKTDRNRRTITFDLGNAVPTTWPAKAQWPQAFPLPLQAVLLPSNGPQIALGNFDLTEEAYQSNAFVQEFKIPAAAEKLIASTPSGVFATSNFATVLAENLSGAYLNFDQQVLRLNPGDAPTVTVWANLFEAPAAGATINLGANDSAFGPTPPDVGMPPDAVSFPLSVTIGANGTGSFQIKTKDPGNPRNFIDGQLYGIGYQWSDDTTPDPSTMISIHLFQQVPVPDAPTWWQDVFPILDQYSRLYPAMQAIIKLNSYKAVVKNIDEIAARLNLPEDDPGYMPITRELSASKKAIILKWIANGHPEGTHVT